MTPVLAASRALRRRPLAITLMDTPLALFRIALGLCVVIAAGVPPRSPARWRTRSMIFMWPRCNPSKLPSASTGACQRGGASSG